MDERFADEPGRTLAELLRRLRERRPAPSQRADQLLDQ